MEVAGPLWAARAAFTAVGVQVVAEWASAAQEVGAGEAFTVEEEAVADMQAAGAGEAANKISERESLRGNCSKDYGRQ